MSDQVVDWPTLLARLAEPFPADQLKWRAGATNKDKTKAIALAYAEPRAYEDRLNEVCPGAWHVDFQPWGESRIICRLTIHGVTRSSTGEAGDSNPEISGTSAEAQALKRACSRFGLGRYLYDLPATWVAYDPKTRRLLETPTHPTSKQNSLQASGPSAGEPAPTLGKDRAQAMHRELTRIGVPPSRHLGLASQVTGRRISSFATLTEQEAARIWRAAQAHADSKSAPNSQAPTWAN